MKRTLSLLFLILYFHLLPAQQVLLHPREQKILKNRGEIYFRFPVNDKNFLFKATQHLSIDQVDHNTAIAYADRQGFLWFLTTKTSYQLLTPPSEKLQPQQLLPRSDKSTGDWDFYPSYDQYLSIMQDFQNQHPDLCEIVSIGKSVQGRELLFAHIHPPHATVDSLPQFMYTSTIHGDEPVGYVLMLHLIDFLLKGYGTDSTITHLIDSTDIWINPLANPDGTYAGGNQSVYGATRFNANQIDLNRNYPDPRVGEHPDGKAWQPETVAFMNFAEQHHFVLSCNLHTGSEVANYPWDTWEKRTADDHWWQQVCRQYADTVHAHARANYFRDLNDGITDGYDWYSIAGGRQDYMNYFQHTREFTLELSSDKMPPSDSLLSYWQYNYRSLIQYIHQMLKGFSGTVTDSLTGKPLKAEIFVLHHDIDHSEVYSDSVFGHFYRPIYPGTYDIEVSRQGYQTKIIKAVTVTSGKAVVKNVMLVPDNYTAIQEQVISPVRIFPNPATNKLFILGIPHCSRLYIFNLSGKILQEQSLNSLHFISVISLPKGIYILKIKTKNNTYYRKFVKQ